MGLPDNDLLAEDLQTAASLVCQAFWIDVYPVTNSSFAGSLLRDGGYQRPEAEP